MMTELCLKGGRNYIHGTTIFDYILDRYFNEGALPQKIDYWINRMTRNKCLIQSKDDGAVDKQHIVGEFNHDLTGLYISETGEEIIKRCEYDESALNDISVFEQGKIFIPQDASTNYTPIEKIIGGNKFLLKRVFNEKYSSYLFARLILEYVPFDDITISFNRIISNRYFESKILEGDRVIGSIYFGFK